MSQQADSTASVGAISGAVAKAPARVEEKATTGSLFRRLWSNGSLAGIYLFLAIMTLFSIFPLYFVLQASFNSTQALISTELRLIPTQPTFDNYIFVIAKEPFPHWLVNSIWACALATFIALLCSTTGAYALSRFRFRGRREALMVLIALQTFPGLLAIYAYLDILATLHLDGRLEGLALVYAAGNIVFGVWNIKGYFDTIPIEMEEAARVDGASYFTIFTQIILPLARPALAASAMFMFIGGWNEFVLAKLILNPDAGSLTVPVGLYQLQLDQYTPWGYFAAAAIIVSIPLMLLFLYAQRFFQSGLTIGSVKG